MRVKIQRFDHQGRGIAYVNNIVTFVPNALPNELVDIEILKKNKNYYLGKVIDFANRSSKRVTSICPYYNQCGGCHLQHLNYQDTINFKQDKIINLLLKNKIKVPNIVLIANEITNHYRNKLTLKIVNKRIGFYEEKTHSLVEIKSCFLAKESINNFLKDINKLQIINGEITIRSNYNDELLIIINTNDKIKFNHQNFSNNKIIGVVLNNKTIYGNNFFYERLYNCLFKVSYDAFFQVNYFITKELFKIVEENINEPENILDLYSGVGTLGIIASKKAKKVYSIEIIKNAVLDNLVNKKLNNRENIEVFLGDAKNVLQKINLVFDTIIIDPPRKGLDKCSLDIILNSAAKKIIYISCDPLTLIRDLKILLTKYEITKYYILDMFSYTYHVESVCILKKSV